eukprot:204794_1
MAKAIFAYFYRRSSAPEMSASSMDDLKFEDAVPIIKKTWGELMKDKHNVGAKIYDFILTKEISMSKLFMQSNIEQQSGIFMMMMNKVVSFLDNPLTFDDNLVVLGQNHVKKYGIKTKHFKHFRSAFLKAIKKYLPWTERREQAWQWFWGRIITQMSHATQANHYPMVDRYNGRELKREEMIQYASYIHESFDCALTSDPKAFADRFYKCLLEEQPDIAELFQDTLFERQSSRFIAMLNHAIKLLDDTRTFTQKLELLSAQHVDYGVQIPMLQSFGDALIRQVKQLNVDSYEKQQSNDGNKKEQGAYESIELLRFVKWTEGHDDAWDWFWKIVVAVMSQGMTKKIKEIKDAKKVIPNKEELANTDFSAI